MPINVSTLTKYFTRKSTTVELLILKFCALNFFCENKIRRRNFFLSKIEFFSVMNDRFNVSEIFKISELYKTSMLR